MRAILLVIAMLIIVVPAQARLSLGKRPPPPQIDNVVTFAPMWQAIPIFPPLWLIRKLREKYRRPAGP
jgi:hypothetical protein